MKDDVKWGPNQCLIKFRHRAEGWREIGRGGIFLERTFLQEPIFAAKPGGNDEDDGYVLIVANHAGEDLCRLHIFDAKKIETGRWRRWSWRITSRRVSTGTGQTPSTSDLILSSSLAVFLFALLHYKASSRGAFPRHKIKIAIRSGMNASARVMLGLDRSLGAERAPIRVRLCQDVHAPLDLLARHSVREPAPSSSPAAPSASSCRCIRADPRWTRR